MSKGRFGVHGGQYIPETLMNAVMELEEAYNHYKDDPEFQAELTELFNEYAGRPSRLYYARRMTEDLGGAKIYLKREDLNHTGAHKINNVLGQALLARKMGKKRLIAETGAGQHGVATATAAALFGMECVVFMGEEDTRRQALNVYKMRLLGATVVPVTSGTATLKDACSAAFREWTTRISDTHYCLGSVMGPHPFPTMVRDFQAVISREIKEQLQEREGKLPDAVIACVGGGSNAIGAFYHFIGNPSVRLIGCEAAGRGVDTPDTAATIATGRLGIFHGMKSYFCQDQYGQIAPVYSISAGLDYPGVGPEHAWLHDTGRAEYVAVTDEEAVNAFGDGSMYLERYVQSPRHIEVQIMADKFGNVIHLGERDCSVQRRHQKMIEESPCAFISPETREKICDTAVQAAKAVGYENAGTIEFLLDQSGEFFFMEMNTRIQVEHPVSELVSGVDLIREQINVAAGLPLSVKQEDICFRGHALECRINAEDPLHNFMPCPGTVEKLYLPGGNGVRMDTAIYPGYTIPPYYDSMIVKIIAYDRDRMSAIRKMISVLGEFRIKGVTTNLDFLYDVLNHPDFQSGMFSTDFIERHYEL